MAKMTVTARLLALLPHKQDSDLQLIFLILPPKDICYCLMCGGLENIPHFSGQKWNLSGYHVSGECSTVLPCPSKLSIV